MSLSRLRSTSGSLRLIPAAPPDGHVDQEPAGQADLRGQPGALVPDRVLRDLHEHAVAGRQRLLDAAGLAVEPGGVPVDLARVEHGVAAAPDVDERRLHGGQHVLHAAEVDVADQGPRRRRGRVGDEMLDEHVVLQHADLDPVGRLAHTIVRSTDSRRARNSASDRIGGRRRPASRPSRRRWRLASRRVEPRTLCTPSPTRVARRRVSSRVLARAADPGDGARRVVVARLVGVVAGPARDGDGDGGATRLALGPSSSSSESSASESSDSASSDDSSPASDSVVVVLAVAVLDRRRRGRDRGPGDRARAATAGLLVLVGVVGVGGVTGLVARRGVVVRGRGDRVLDLGGLGGLVGSASFLRPRRRDRTCRRARAVRGGLLGVLGGRSGRAAAAAERPASGRGWNIGAAEERASPAGSSPGLAGDATAAAGPRGRGRVLGVVRLRAGASGGRSRRGRGGRGRARRPGGSAGVSAAMTCSAVARSRWTVRFGPPARARPARTAPAAGPADEAGQRVDPQFLRQGRRGGAGHPDCPPVSRWANHRSTLSSFVPGRLGREGGRAGTLLSLRVRSGARRAILVSR